MQSTADSICATKIGQTDTLGCSVPVGGHWLDLGITTACTSQTGCATDDTNACTTGSGTDATKLKCTTLEAGYQAPPPLDPTT